jgi:dephospho-CoA kinase
MIIGVTGNTGTGKTVVSEFYKKWGAKVISCDELGWSVLQKPHIIEQIKGNFEEVVEGGKVKREKLGAIVFADESKLEKLNKIVHPELLKKLKNEIKSSKKKVVVVDGALIFEWGIENWFDYIILLTSTLEDKRKRLKRQGLTEKIIDGRLNSQGDSSSFIKYSDFIIENDGDQESLKNNAKWIWDKITRGKRIT